MGPEQGAARRPGGIVRGLWVAGIGAALVAVLHGTAAAATAGGPAEPVATSSMVLQRDTVGAFDPATGEWHLGDADGDVASFYFGNPGDVPFVGDWDCDGVDTPGLYRSADGFVYLRNSNTQGNADAAFYFGDPGDLPVAGDFDGDGCDTVAVFRPAAGRIYLADRLGETGRGLGAADRTVELGDPGDVPFAGDFDGDGIDEVGVYRPTDATVHRPGVAPLVLGNPGDRLVAGDWSGSARAQPGVYRPSANRFYLLDEAGAVENSFRFGGRAMVAVAGAFGDLPAGDGALPADGEPEVAVADPLGLVTATGTVRFHSLGEDRFAVWRCDVAGWSDAIGETALGRILDGAVTEWFTRWSGGRYTPRFTFLGTLVAPSRAGCLGAARAATPGGYDAALVVTDDDLSGIASPGAPCLAFTPCSPEYPANGRVAMVGADALRVSPATAVHEIGHTLHWPHSRSGLGNDPYDNPMDVMSGAAWAVIPGTVAFNRYQAGWIDPADVAVYAGEALDLVLVPPGASGIEMLVIPTGTAGRYYTAGARLSGPADPVPASGVEVYLVDETCGTGGSMRCIGAASLRLQTPAAPDGTGHVLSPGTSTVVAGVGIAVTAAAGGYRVAVSG